MKRKRAAAGCDDFVPKPYSPRQLLAKIMRKNRKAHFTLFNVDAPSAALNEIERQERLNEDVLRYITVRVEEHEEGPSAMMRKVDRDRDRDDRGGGFRDRDRGVTRSRRPRRRRRRRPRPRRGDRRRA